MKVYQFYENLNHFSFLSFKKFFFKLELRNKMENK